MLHPQISRTRVVRFNVKNTKRLENIMGEYDDVNEIISKLFDAYDCNVLRSRLDNLENFDETGISGRKRNIPEMVIL